VFAYGACSPPPLFSELAYLMCYPVIVSCEVSPGKVPQHHVGHIPHPSTVWTAISDFDCQKYKIGVQTIWIFGICYLWNPRNQPHCRRTTGYLAYCSTATRIALNTRIFCAMRFDIKSAYGASSPPEGGARSPRVAPC
jgi:hypothetical protein